MLQCDFSNRATWKKMNQSEPYLRTKESDLFLKSTNNIEEYEQYWDLNKIEPN